MTKAEKLAEIAHIRTMLAEGGGDDEINARVWCVLKGVKYHSIQDVMICHGVNLTKFTTSLTACKGIQDEGWGVVEMILDWKAVDGKPVFLWKYALGELCLTNPVLVEGRALPTMERAWLDAILQTWAWRIENASN